MNTTKTSLILALLTGFSFAAHAYDHALAEQVLNTVTGQMNRQFMTAPNSKFVVDVTEVLEILKKKEKVVLLDVRTPEEREIVALSYPQAVFVPLNELFKKENLDRLPQDRKIIVICQSGPRAAFATSLLMAIGFKDVKFLKGGLMALVTDLTPKTVPSQ